jgi:hypothetical protein
MYPAPRGGAGSDQEQGAQSPTERTAEQRADIGGNVMLTAPGWLDPNLVAQVTIGDASLSLMGMRFSLADAVKPLLDRTVNEQVTALQKRVREDTYLEASARANGLFDLSSSGPPPRLSALGAYGEREKSVFLASF